jgi:small subunit ribosomal protein S20
LGPLCPELDPRIANVPNTRSAKKRLRQSRKRALRNKAWRSRVRTVLKKVRAATDPAQAADLYRQAVSLLDRAVSKGLLHRNAAARTKSRLAARVRALGARV